MRAMEGGGEKAGSIFSSLIGPPETFRRQKARGGYTNE